MKTIRNYRCVWVQTHNVTLKYTVRNEFMLLRSVIWLILCVCGNCYYVIAPLMERHWSINPQIQFRMILKIFFFFFFQVSSSAWGKTWKLWVKFWVQKSHLHRKRFKTSNDFKANIITFLLWGFFLLMSFARRGVDCMYFYYKMDSITYRSA